MWGIGLLITATAGVNYPNYRWELLNKWAILVELLGFSILILGNLVYNEIVRIPYFQPPVNKNEIEPLLDESEESRNESVITTSNTDFNNNVWSYLVYIYTSNFKKMFLEKYNNWIFKLIICLYLFPSDNNPMIRTLPKLARHFSNLKLPSSTFDISNSVGYLNAVDTPAMSLFDKFACFSPGNIYTSFDVFTREFLFTLANDYHLGVPAAIVISSFLLRGLFL